MQYVCAHESRHLEITVTHTVFAPTDHFVINGNDRKNMLEFAAKERFPVFDVCDVCGDRLEVKP